MAVAEPDLLGRTTCHDLHIVTVVTRHRFSTSQGDSLGEAPSPSIYIYKNFWEDGFRDRPGVIAHIAIQNRSSSCTEPEIPELAGGLRRRHLYHGRKSRHTACEAVREGG